MCVRSMPVYIQTAVLLTQELGLHFLHVEAHQGSCKHVIVHSSHVGQHVERDTYCTCTRSALVYIGMEVWLFGMFVVANGGETINA